MAAGPRPPAPGASALLRTTAARRPRPQVVATLDAAALDERGWPSMHADPRGAAARAARSLAYLAADHRVVLLHTLPYGISSSAGGNGARHASGAWAIGRLLDLELGRALRAVDGAQVTVLARRDGSLEDAHHAGAELAAELDAHALLVFLPQPAVWAQVDGRRRAIRVASPATLRGVALETPADARAVRAAVTFVQMTGHRAAIGAIDHAEALVRQEGGTVIRPSAPSLTCYGARPEGVSPSPRREVEVREVEAEEVGAEEVEAREVEEEAADDERTRTSVDAG